MQHVCAVDVLEAAKQLVHERLGKGAGRGVMSLSDRKISKKLVCELVSEEDAKEKTKHVHCSPSWAKSDK